MEGFGTKWERLSKQLAGQTQQQGLDKNALTTNQNLYSGLSALGNRGANVGGSQERLAAKSGMIGGQGAFGVGANAQNQLASNLGEGLQKITLPGLIGQDMARAQAQADNRGIFGLGILGL